VALLHSLVEQLSFACRQDGMSTASRRRLIDACQATWDARTQVEQSAADDPRLSAQIKADLLELSVLWADLASRQTPAAGQPAPKQPRAVAILDEAAAALGPSPILARERAAFAAAATGDADVLPTDMDDRSVRNRLKTGWEHYAYGRALLREGRLVAAAEVLERAVELAPQDFWANFYQADCAYRLRENALALSALRVCIALAPEKAEGYFNRGLVHAAREDWAQADGDFSRALALDGSLGAAVVERGKVRRQLKQLHEALADLQKGLELGGDPATIQVEIARVHLDRNDRSAAIAAVERALAASPEHQGAIELRSYLRSSPH
jgi:tetratricopeptide (TPR) repeat protein